MTSWGENRTTSRGASLRTRVLFVVLLIFLGGATATFVAINWFSQDVIRTLASWFAEKSVLYEKTRVQQVLLREITLTQKMASSPLFKAWVHNEADPALRSRAIAELEDYRAFYRSKSYFFAIAGSGHYYFNDEKGGHDPHTPRYTLDRNIGKDAWFYETLRQVKDYQLNVNTDRHLGVTRVWINTVLKDENRPLAVMGTGVDLTDFIQSVVNTAQPGVTNILLDGNGAIQAHRDVSMIDFASIAKRERQEQQSTIYQLIDNDADRAAFRSALGQLAVSEDGTRSLPLAIQGSEHVAGVAYLPSIKWYLVTLTRPELAQDEYYIRVIAGVLVGSLALTLLVAAVLFDGMVLRRVAALDGAARRIAEGDYAVTALSGGNDELSRLGASFDMMAQRISTHTTELESQIAERTAALERLAYADFLTGLLNRRGMLERIDAEKNRLMRHGGQMGVLAIDLDHFKDINDRHGHGIGDQAIVGCAKMLRELVRSYDLCARWGGEEFLVIMPEIPGPDELLRTAEKLRAIIKNTPLKLDGTTISLTVSIGCCLADARASVDAMLKSADNALYRAKQRGRNCVELDETLVQAAKQNE